LKTARKCHNLRRSGNIENTRLLNELRQRTDDLTESLEQQTATSEILEVISNSPTDTQPVFDAIVRSGLNLFPDAVVTISLPDRDLIKLGAIGGADEAGVEALRGRFPMPLSREFITGTAILDQREIDIADAHEPPNELRAGAQNLLAGGYSAMTVLPMVRGDETIGTLNVVRRNPGPLSDKQRELLRTFANQAVIAIENTRLFNELRESLQQQTATSEVLRVISSSPGELQPVFMAMLENAVRICEAKFGTMFLREGDAFRTVALHNAPPAYAELRRRNPIIYLHPKTALARLVATRQVVQIADILEDQGYLAGAPNTVAIFETAGARTFLLVPMLKANEVVGAILIYRQQVRPFTDKQIELVTTFADQAVIAIENVRLLTETREALENLRTTQDRLVQTQKLASLGQLTAGIAHEIKNPLNFVNNFSGLSSELIDELQDTLKGIPLDDKARTELEDLTATLRGNLDKVVEHGTRADSIVKNMLLHSREGSGEHRPVAVNALVEESFNLAYHGARAEKRNFDVMVERSLDPVAGEVHVFPQEITRVLLNLISNGVYATTKKAPTDGETYKPVLTVSTKDLGDRVEIKIRDNGMGISPDVKDKMFNPFFTTKPAGEGTGLGLSISHDIIVKQHGGSIEVDTQPGEFTEFTIILPRAAVFLAGQT
jgi:signal transduction histidine kinase